MDAHTRAQIVTALSTAFGDAQDLTPAQEQPLHVVLTRLELPEPWKPSPTRALTIWRNWPSERPEFAIDQGVVGETGEPPIKGSTVLHLGETWRTPSFTFPWKGNDPVIAVQLWLGRFLLQGT
jgi:hypothetical protein